MAQRYVHFGELPASGHSYNPVEGCDEAGICTYTATEDWGTEIEIHGAGADAYLADLVAHRIGYLLEGTHCGQGYDGEDLITDARIVGRVVPTAEAFVFAVVKGE